MTAVVWPFKPLSELIEELRWLTDVIQAKSAEQRIALRTAPRRVFQLQHMLTDYEYSHARSLVREAQGGDGFLFPDWSQSISQGAVAAGSSVAVTGDLSVVDIGDQGLLWQSVSVFEVVDLTTDSNGTTMDTVAGNYTSARFMPLWPGDLPEGLTASRAGARYNSVSCAAVLSENNDLAATPAATYRSLDVLDECPVIGNGALSEGLGWEVTPFENPPGVPKYLRDRSTPDVRYTMRWFLQARAEQFALRQWLHYRRGRQRAFWMSSRGEDLEPSAAIASTTVQVFAFAGLTGLGRTDPFDIEVKTVAASYYRRVTALAAGSPVNGRATINMTIDSTLSVSLSDIVRVSYLRCTRLDADRVEFLHQAGTGLSVQVPMIEVPTP